MSDLPTVVDLSLGDGTDPTELIADLEASGYDVSFRRQHHDTIRDANVLSYWVNDE